MNSAEDLESNLLFHNNGDHTFSDATDDAGLAGIGWSGDVAVFDFDDDGDLDLFVTNMFGLSQLYANDGRGHFRDVTRKTLQHTSYRAIGCKAFDYNNDARLDLFIADMHSDMWMEYDEKSLVEPRRKYRYVLGHKVELDPRLMGEEAKWVARLGIDYRVMLRQVQAAGGYLSQSSKTLHFGLGPIDHIDRAEIRWPSGIRQSLESPAVNTLIEVREPAATSSSVETGAAARD